MPRAAKDLKLRRLQDEIESFVRAQTHPVLAEDDAILFDLTASSWRLTVEYQKLLFEVWNPARSVARRVEEIAYRDRGRLGLFVRKAAGKGTTTLEIREAETTTRVAAGRGRGTFQRQLLATLAKEYPGWKFERVSHSTDREHSFSSHYTRGLARRGTSSWAFLGLSPEEGPGAAAPKAA